MKRSTPHPSGTRCLSNIPGPKSQSALHPTLSLHALSHARLVLFVPAQSRLAGAGPEAECQVCGSCSGVWGLWDLAQHPAPPTQCPCSSPCLVGSPNPELKSLGALRVNDRAVPSSPCTGRRPSQGEWYQGSPCPRQCCSVLSLREGHRLVLSLSKGGMGNYDRKCSWPSRSHGDPRCPATAPATDVRRPTPVPVGVLGREPGLGQGWWLA